MENSIWIGHEPREAAAFAVARHSIRRRTPRHYPINGVVLSYLREAGLYTRPTSRKKGVLWDDISDAPMATEFACSRFLVPYLARKMPPQNDNPRWAVFMDCDMLVRQNLTQLFHSCDSSKAVMCVKHNHNPTETTKMDGQIQTRYARKNWSSVMVFNIDHPANAELTIGMINTLPGRDLHRFCWLDDGDIGELDPGWNYLIGDSEPHPDPGIVHFTNGIPLMGGYENCEYADEWRAELDRWAK